MNGVVQERHIALKTAQAELQKHTGLISQLETLQEGTKCPTCHGVISKDNYKAVLVHAKKEASGCQIKIDSENAAIQSTKTQIGEKFSAITNMEESIQKAEQKLAMLEQSISAKRLEMGKLTSLSKPEVGAAERVLEAEISEFKRQLREKKNEFDNGSPYQEIIEQAKKDKEDKELKSKEKAKELQAAEKEIPYYEYWVKAFGDSGIRK
jgi:DNA repair exonuclease SbcCD ATPase subunit